MADDVVHSLFNEAVGLRLYCESSAKVPGMCSNASRLGWGCPQQKGDLEMDNPKGRTREEEARAYRELEIKYKVHIRVAFYVAVVITALLIVRAYLSVN